MRKPEQAFYTWLKPHLPGEFCRVENIVDPGMPDISDCWPGFGDIWFELKVSDKKVFPGLYVVPFQKDDPYKVLRPTQVVWHILRAKEGSKVFTLVRHPDALLIYKMSPEGEFFLHALLPTKRFFPKDMFKTEIERILKEDK